MLVNAELWSLKAFATCWATALCELAYREGSAAAACVDAPPHRVVAVPQSPEQVWRRVLPYAPTSRACVGVMQAAEWGESPWLCTDGAELAWLRPSTPVTVCEVDWASPEPPSPLAE